jgi:nitrite reductase/ring-hydroxylating ferredoxin subunit
MGGSLCDGNLEADVIVCPRHGAAFNVKTGKNVRDAKIAFIKMKVKDVSSIPVKVDGHDILVGM